MVDAHPDWIPGAGSFDEGSIEHHPSQPSSIEPVAPPRDQEPGLEFRPMLAGDAVLLELQDSQRFELGLDHPHFTIVEGRDLAYSEGSVAWTAFRGARIVAIAGLRQLFPGHAVAWAALSGAVGGDHLAITRKARQVIAAATSSSDASLGSDAPRFHRIECLVEADNERAIAWALLLGLKFLTVVRKYGPERRDHIFFEQVAP